MLYILLILLYYCIPFHQLCPSPCTECPSFYYYNKGIQLKEEIDFFTDCSLRIPSDIIYTKDFYLTNRSCDDIFFKSTCIGDADNPIDDFWKLIKKIFNEDEAQKYQTQNIKIFLLGIFKYSK